MSLFARMSGDATTSLQAWMNECAASSDEAILSPGSYRITAPLVIPSQLKMRGFDPGGGFVCAIRPENCRAFTSIDSHHSSISNLMIWPLGDAPPDCYIYADKSYSQVFRDMRIHLSAGQVPCTQAAIVVDGLTGRNNNLIFDNLVIRSDGRAYPVGYQFNKLCGTVQLVNPDVETCDLAFHWKGGRITMTQPYIERIGAAVLKADIDQADTGCQFSVHGGTWSPAHSGFAMQLYRNIKNLTFYGVYLDTDLCQWEGYWYTPDHGVNVAFYGCRMNQAKWNVQPTIQ